VNAAFLSGGISYDGVHPTSLGYAVWADEMVRFINANYGTTIPRVDISGYLFSGNSSQGGYPVNLGANLTTEEVITWGAAVYTPEVMRTLADTFPVSARTAVAAPAAGRGSPCRPSRVAGAPESTTKPLPPTTSKRDRPRAVPLAFGRDVGLPFAGLARLTSGSSGGSRARRKV
jgi:hypothetical protein